MISQEQWQAIKGKAITAANVGRQQIVLLLEDNTEIRIDRVNTGRPYEPDMVLDMVVVPAKKDWQFG